MSMSLPGSRFSSESAPGPFQHGIRGEVEQSNGRPCVAVGRSKRPSGLTSSLVPRGTPFHRCVELETDDFEVRPFPSGEALLDTLTSGGADCLVEESLVTQIWDAIDARRSPSLDHLRDST